MVRMSFARLKSLLRLEGKLEQLDTLLDYIHTYHEPLNNELGGLITEVVQLHREFDTLMWHIQVKVTVE